MNKSNPFNLNKTMKVIYTMLFMLTTIITHAEPAAAQASESPDFVSLFVYATIGIILLVLVFLFSALNTMIKQMNPGTEKSPLFAGLLKKLTDTVPVEREEEILTDHIYDGIQELDNNLPPWWKYMFYATIVFSGVYIYYYHFNDNGLLQTQEYEQEMVVAKAEVEAYMKTAANSIDETNVKLSDAKGIEKGKSLFVQNCAACHGKDGEGGVGPNLTYEYWLHGGDIKDVFKTIKYGVPQKGMISWKAQLSPMNIQEISSFILSIKGTNPPNAKEPQGDKYEGKKIAGN